MALTDYPKWVPDQKRSGTEIRFKDGRYYLYGCSSFYDKERKKICKKTGKYLGSITEADSLVPARRRMVVSETPLDKGFASEKNFSKLEEKGLTYVVGIRRSDSHLDYSCFRERDNSGMDGLFEYEGR